MFNTGKSALFASRSALTTTGHNVANVNTEGYSRQRVNQETAPGQKLGGSVYGTGVRVAGVERVNDDYLTKQVANESKFLGQYQEKDVAMSQADAIFNELNNEGLNRLMSRFFNEFRKLGNEPESEALRTTVKESADQLVGDFKRISRSIRDIQKNIDVRLEANVKQINEITDKLVNINEQINRMELGGGNANDLKDTRDLNVRKLSEIADIQVGSNEKGEFTIAIQGIGPLVSGSLKNKIYLETTKHNPENNRPENSVVVRMEHNPSHDISDKLNNGRIGGLIESRDKILGVAQRKIDELAFHFSNNINNIHRQGFAINGSTGVDFFESLGDVYGSAERLSLSSAVQMDANNIATALEANSPGDNRLIQKIAQLQHQRVMGNGTSTFDSHYNSTVADLATIQGKNKQVLEHQMHTVDQLDRMRQSISGVSMDEETANLVQYQQAFNASAKVIQVADEMLDTVMSIKR